MLLIYTMSTYEHIFRYLTRLTHLLQVRINKIFLYVRNYTSLLRQQKEVK